MLFIRGVSMYVLPGREYRKCTPSRAEARTSIEYNFKQGARPRRICDGRAGPSRSAVPLDLHHLSSVCFLGSGGCVKKKGKDYCTKRLNERGSNTIHHVPTSRFATPQNGDLSYATKSNSGSYKTGMNASPLCQTFPELLRI